MRSWGEAYRRDLHPRAGGVDVVFIYLVMAFWAGLGLVLNTRFVDDDSALHRAIYLHLVALWTGALWGKPALRHPGYGTRG